MKNNTMNKNVGINVTKAGMMKIGGGLVVAAALAAAVMSQTGDTRNVMMMASMLILSCAGMMGVGILSRR